MGQVLQARGGVSYLPFGEMLLLALFTIPIVASSGCNLCRICVPHTSCGRLSVVVGQTLTWLRTRLARQQRRESAGSEWVEKEGAECVATCTRLHLKKMKRSARCHHPFNQRMGTFWMYVKKWVGICMYVRVYV